jgi:hypothetical protein
MHLRVLWFVQLVCGSKATDAHIDAAGTLSYHDVVELGLDGQLEFSVDIARLAADCRRPSMSTTLSGVCADVRSIAGPGTRGGCVEKRDGIQPRADVEVVERDNSPRAPT